MALLQTIKTKMMLSDMDKLGNLRAQLKAAESDRDAARAALGAALLDEVPPAAADATAQIEAADKRFRDLTAAIDTISRRIQVAADRKKEDAKAAQREVLRSALAKVQSDARAVEHDFETLHQHTKALQESVNEALSAAAVLGDDARHSLLSNGRAKFKFYLLHHASVMPGCKTPYIKSLERYSENFPKPAELK